jgi:hypothetical protein
MGTPKVQFFCDDHLLLTHHKIYISQVLKNPKYICYNLFLWVPYINFKVEIRAPIWCVSH